MQEEADARWCSAEHLNGALPVRTSTGIEVEVTDQVRGTMVV
jgi:hypothetical protein